MEYIDTEAGLEAASARLENAPLIAADTEAAGFHRYHDRICLLQISSRTETFIVDTLELEHLDPLEPAFAEPTVEVVFHDADYDLRLLHRDFGLRVRGLFDTKIAAQLLGEPAIGLASLLERHLGVRLEKRYQRADWAQRPLPGPMLEYAALDTRYLPALRDTLRAALEEKGRLSWAEEEFRIQENHAWTTTTDTAPESAYLRLKNTRDLRPRQLAALRDLYAWREAHGRERDVAPFRIMSNDALTELARRLPLSLDEAERIQAIPRSVLARHGEELIEILRRVRALSESELPHRPRTPPPPPVDPEAERALERLKVARDGAALELGLDRGFLLPRHQLERVARSRPQTLEELASIPGIRRWQVEAVGERLLSAL